MGLIKAAAGAIGGVMADQWKEYFYCEALDTDTIVREIGKRLLEVFAIAQELSWDMSIQQNNIEYLLEAEKTTYGIGSEIRRAFVYHFCILLNTQGSSQRQISPEEAVNFVQNHAIPNIGEN